MNTPPRLETQSSLDPRSDATAAPTSESSSGRSWRPRPWLAGILSVLVPGLGHVYAGRPGRAVGAYILYHAWAVLLTLLTFALLDTAVRVGLFLLVVPGAMLALAADAVYIARRAPVGRRDLQRLPILAGLGLFVALALNPLVTGAMRAEVVQAFRIPSGAMAPTLLPGDWLFADMRDPSSLRRDEPIVMLDDDMGHVVYRVAGLPGDTLSMQDFRFFRDGRPVHEPWARLRDSALVLGQSNDDSTAELAPPPGIRTWGPLVVPSDSIFVLGDTRDASADSRYRGFIARQRVVGRPQWLYFSFDATRGTVRWHRIGLRIQ